MARKIADTKKMTHEEWINLRKSSIGGSDSGVCVNENPYSSLLTLYADKMGLSKDKEDNEAMRLGRDLEQYVADRFTEKTGIKVRNDFGMYADDEYDFMTANVDRRIVGENAGLECKTMSSFLGYNLEAGEIPGHYYAQLQHYMMVMGYDYMWICFLVFQRGVYELKVNRNDDYIAQLRKAEIDFWKNHIEKGIAPEPDGSEASIQTLKDMYPKSSGAEIEILGLDQMIADYKAFGEMEKEYKEKKDKAQAQICARLGSAEVGLGTKYGCSWKEQSRDGIDTKRLKAEKPDIYAAYSKVSSYRVFRTKQLVKEK